MWLFGYSASILALSSDWIHNRSNTGCCYIVWHNWFFISFLQSAKTIGTRWRCVTCPDEKQIVTGNSHLSYVSFAKFDYLCLYCCLSVSVTVCCCFEMFCDFLFILYRVAQTVGEICVLLLHCAIANICARLWRVMLQRANICWCLKILMNYGMSLISQTSNWLNVIYSCCFLKLKFFLML